MILDVGAGWQEREHTLFGHELGDIPTRMARLEEGLEVITRLLHSDEPVTFEGKFFQLREATLLPRPQRPSGPDILIGGNGVKRTLPLVAKYANIWNAVFLPPAAFAERSTLLDSLLQQAGRKPSDVRRTMMDAVTFGRNMKELDHKLGWLRDLPEYANKSVQEILETPRSHSLIAGTADMIIKHIKAYGEAGVEELMLQWFDTDDIDGLRAFAESVLPAI